MSVPFRPYHFPPLDVVQAGSPAHAAQPNKEAAHQAQELVQAYEQAVQRGYAQGLQQGQVDGARTGHDAGFEAGRQAGMEAARAEVLRAAQGELERLGAPVTAVAQQLQQLHTDWEASLRKDLIDLVEKVARQVVRCELTLQPAQILSLVEETLEGMPQRTGTVHVFLNPADLQRIQELDRSYATDWQLQPDSTLEAGECRLRVGEEEVDAGCRQRMVACMDQVREQLQPVESM